MSVFERRGAYHSELVRVTDPDAVIVTFKGEPRKSKDGDSYFVYFEVQGESEEHYLNIENEDCLQTIRDAPTGEPVMLEAAGRDKSATLRITPLDNGQQSDKGISNLEQHYDEMGNPGRPVEAQLGGNAPNQEQPQRENEPQRSEHEQMYWRAVIAAKNIHERFYAEFSRTLTDDERNTATTIFIALSR